MTDAFRCVFAAMQGDIPFRLDRRTPRPVMRGPQTAKVTGAPGDEITTDEYGRIKVKFFWDRSAMQDDNSSCWIRVAQIWAGANWGGMFIPRVGQEVVVEFLDGDPDRPIITGCVYNANQGVPYPLPDNKTRSGIKTHSSTGSGNNELRFEDKAGSGGDLPPGAEGLQQGGAEQRDGEDHPGHHDDGGKGQPLGHRLAGQRWSDGLDRRSHDHGLRRQQHDQGRPVDPVAGRRQLRADRHRRHHVVGSKVSIMAQESMSVDGGLSMTLQAAQIAIN